MKKYFVAKSRRLRSTPYSSRIEKQGVTAYTVYNHMLLPAGFGSLEDSYFHLKESVQVWDVAAERQVEISGIDSAKLVELRTCRARSKSKVGRCYYCPVIDDKAGLINDPVVLKLSEQRWWISIADSDVILFAKGLAIGHKFNVKIFEPTVDILAVQGPKSFARSDSESICLVQEENMPLWIFAVFHTKVEGPIQSPFGRDYKELD